jgi:succinate-acetate transporter protein
MEVFPMSGNDIEEELKRLRGEIDNLKDKGVAVSEKLANPAPLGLAGFGLTTLLLNTVNAEIISSEGIGMVLPVGLFYGGLAQFLAGMWEAKKNNTFGFTAFSSFGAFWMALGVLIILERTGVVEPVPVSGMTVFLVAWGLFTAYMTIGTLRLSVALQVVFTTLTILFFLLAIGEHNETVKQIAGYEGLLCAGSALYASAALVINETWGREMLPLGVVK